MKPLRERLIDRITVEGAIPFKEFMAACLYDAEDGYYARTQAAEQIGRRGDFYTSVSVGPVFGELLARYAFDTWLKCESPSTFALIECGAHQGQLAGDILRFVREKSSSNSVWSNFWKALHYHIVELLPRLKEAQERALAVFERKVTWHNGTPTSSLAAHGLILGNELLDAFPCERVRWDGSQWHRLGVSINTQGRFQWAELALTPTLAKDLTDATNHLPPGWTTERGWDWPAWLQTASLWLVQGNALLLDYGRDSVDYFAPTRREGTLRGYRQHQRCDDPFLFPGETDLTTDVDWTLIAKVATEAGWRLSSFQRQEAFLISCATTALKEMEAAHQRPAASWLRQFQTLTHPSLMGQAFQVMVLSKG